MPNLTLPDEIPSSRLTLLALRVEHAQELFSLIDGDRERLMRTQAWVEPMTSVEIQISRLRQLEEKRLAGTTYGFAIAIPDNGGPLRLVGGCGVFNISRDHRRCELGYWIVAECEGKGLVSETVETMERACFEAGFHRIEIRCSSLNPRSSAVPVRLGYQLDGRLREHWREDGATADELIYAKLSREQDRPGA